MAACSGPFSLGLDDLSRSLQEKHLALEAIPAGVICQWGQSARPGDASAEVFPQCDFLLDFSLGFLCHLGSRFGLSRFAEMTLVCVVVLVFSLDTRRRQHKLVV